MKQSKMGRFYDHTNHGLWTHGDRTCAECAPEIPQILSCLANVLFCNIVSLFLFYRFCKPTSFPGFVLKEYCQNVPISLCSQQKSGIVIFNLDNTQLVSTANTCTEKTV